MSDDDSTIEDMLQWSEDKLQEEESKTAVIEPIKYKPQPVNFIKDGEEHAPSEEQQKRISAIMKPLDNIHFSWSVEQMQNIVKDGIEKRKKILEELGVEDNNKEIEQKKVELSSLIKQAIKMGNNISSEDSATEKEFTILVGKIKVMKVQLDEMIENNLTSIQNQIESQFTAKHEDNDEIDVNMPKLLKAKEKYIENHKATDDIWKSAKKAPTKKNLNITLQNLEEFFKNNGNK